MSAELLTYRMGIPPNVHSGVGAPQCENRTNSRWQQLFGTPERAAQTLRNIPCGNKPCVDCPIYEPCCGKFSEGHYNPLLEWLRG